MAKYISKNGKTIQYSHEAKGYVEVKAEVDLKVKESKKTMKEIEI